MLSDKVSIREWLAVFYNFVRITVQLCCFYLNVTAIPFLIYVFTCVQINSASP